MFPSKQQQRFSARSGLQVGPQSRERVCIYNIIVETSLADSQWRVLGVLQTTAEAGSLEDDFYTHAYLGSMCSPGMPGLVGKMLSNLFLSVGCLRLTIIHAYRNRVPR